MTAASVGIWEMPCVCFLDVELAALGCQDEVSLVVSLPGCFPRRLVRVENVGKGESVALGELYEPQSSVVSLSNAKASYCPCPALVCGRASFGIAIG